MLTLLCCLLLRKKFEIFFYFNKQALFLFIIRTEILSLKTYKMQVLSNLQELNTKIIYIIFITCVIQKCFDFTFIYLTRCCYLGIRIHTKTRFTIISALFMLILIYLILLYIYLLQQFVCIIVLLKDANQRFYIISAFFC